MNTFIKIFIMISLLYLTKGEILYNNTTSISRRIRQPREEMSFAEFKNNAVLVHVGKNAITEADSTEPFIYSDPARDCVLVTLYCKSEQIGGIAHITINQNPEIELNLLFKKFLDANKNITIIDLEARIIGGKAGLSETTASTIIDVLNANNILIIENDILTDSPRIIVLDTQHDGKVFDVINF